MLSGISFKPVHFGFRPNIPHLEKLRDALMKQFPGGPDKHANGSGISNIGPSHNPVGIAIYHPSQKDRQTVIDHLLKNNIIKKEANGTYSYQGAPVGFEVLGQVTPQKK